jgi:hypothetical protein
MTKNEAYWTIIENSLSLHGFKEIENVEVWCLFEKKVFKKIKQIDVDWKRVDGLVVNLENGDRRELKILPEISNYFLNPKLEEEPKTYDFDKMSMDEINALIAEQEKTIK